MSGVGRNIGDSRLAVYLDLEHPADLARLQDAETYLDTASDRPSPE